MWFWKRAENPGVQPAAELCDGQSRGELARLVTALLRVPTRELDLPPRLMKLYLQSRWANRREIIVAWLVAIAAINAAGAAFDPFVTSQPEIWVFLAGRLGVSALFLASAATIRDTEVSGIEGAIVIACCVATIVVAGLGGLLITVDFMETRFVEAMVIAASAILVARISWRDTVLLTSILLALLTLFMAIAPEPVWAERVQMIVFFGLGIIGLTVARRAQNRFLYKVFLNGLSERLKMGEIKDMNGRLATMARTDPLTLLANRRHFDETFDALKLGTDAKAEIAMVMIDIDYFKRLNDDLGHAAGDDCLRVVAGLIRDQLRDGQDFVARFGGEEFVAVLSGRSSIDALAIADRLRHAVEARRLANPRSPYGVVTVSVGVALSPPGDIAMLVEHADSALYRAKSLGRNKVAAFGVATEARVA